MNRIVHFFSYHNAVPIALSFMLLGAGGVFAATNPEAIYSAEQKTITVDNTYIANKDLGSFTPRIEISGVTEDTENYYIAYRFTTIDVEDAVWRDVIKMNTLEVAKSALGDTIDLGLYATEQFNQLIGHELERLHETQVVAQKAVSQKIVATEYGGLVGKFLDSTTEELPGYQPVVVPPPPPPEVVHAEEPQAQVAAAAQPSTPPPPAPAQEEPPPPSENTESGSTLSVQLLGNNPVHISVGANYTDLGVVIQGQNDPFTVHHFVNGSEVQGLEIDTANPGEWHIRYKVSDASGATVSAERTVIVSAAEPSTPPSEGSGSTSTPENPPQDEPQSTTTPQEPQAPTSTPPEDPAPEPEPEESEPEEPPPPAEPAQEGANPQPPPEE